MKAYISFKSLVMLGIVALAALFGMPTGNIVAAPLSKTTTKITRETTHWSLTPEQCPDIQLAINGTGQRFEVTTTITKADGSTLTIDNDSINGTATDSQGGTYQFIYANQTRQLAPPTSGAPIRVNMSDTFLLTGNHGANNLELAFHWKWTYTPPAEYWPPVDNWKKMYSVGDSLHCDPT